MSTLLRSISSFGRPATDPASPTEDRPQRPRRMTSLEVGVREAVAPRSLPRTEDLSDHGNAATLADLAFVDGTASVFRLVRRMSTAASAFRGKEEGGEEASELVSDTSAAPPPPPPPVPVTDSVKEALDAAAQRRKLSRGESGLMNALAEE